MSEHKIRPTTEKFSEQTEWTVSQENPGFREKTIQHGNCTIKVLRPILDPAEREKREHRASLEIERGLRGYLLRKERKNEAASK